MSAFPTGPHVNAAFLCEKVLTEQDGVNSYIRVVDRFVRQVVSPEQPMEIPPMQVSTVLAIVLKPDRALGSFQIAVELEKPSGEKVPGHEFTVNFSGGPNAGVNVHVQLQVALDEAGLWWIDLLGGEGRQLMSRVPMELQDQWIKGQVMPGPSPQP